LIATGQSAPPVTWEHGTRASRANIRSTRTPISASTTAREASESFELDRNPAVESWVKNDHLGFEILYVYRGVVRKYRPDFLIRLKDGNFLILEAKGKDTEQDQTKREFLAEWVNAVNSHGGFGSWFWDVSFNPGDLKDILAKHAHLTQIRDVAAA
jgi:type III restriction enzyme